MGQRDRNLGLSKSSFLEKLSEMSAKLFGGASLKSMIFLIPKKGIIFKLLLTEVRPEVHHKKSISIFGNNEI